MDRIAIFLAAVAPGLLLLAYGIAITRGTWRNEAIWTAFFVGGVGAVAAVPLEFGLQWLVGLYSLAPLPQAAVRALVVAAIPEETIKFIVLLGPAERHVDASRRQDVVALALAVSLGFATIENLFYVAILKDWQFIAAGRAVSAVPGHAIAGLAMGALVLAARLYPTRQALKLLLALLVPITLHAAYDFPLLAMKDAPEQLGVWLTAAWLAILAMSAIAAIALCKRVLPAAVEADRLSGSDLRADGPAVSIIVAGCALLVLSPVLGAVTFLMKDVPFPWLGAALSILPMALAMDLIWTGLRRQRAMARQPLSKSSCPRSDGSI
jgi:RsiW-degrading membrane proteinase PrsW (M82 family)